MTTVLDGADYLFEFRHSQREDCWYFSISLTDGTRLAAGVKVVCNRPLLARFANVNLPPGILMATTTNVDKSPPKRAELGQGQRVTLVYFSKAELA